MECELIAYTTVSESHKVYYNLTTSGFPIDASATNVVDFGKTSQLSSTGLSAMGVIGLFEAMGMVFTNKRRCRMIAAIATFNHAATILLEAYRPEGNTDGEVCFESPRRDIRLTNSLALPAAKCYNSSGRQFSRAAIERILTKSLLYNFRGDGAMINIHDIANTRNGTQMNYDDIYIPRGMNTVSNGTQMNYDDIYLPRGIKAVSNTQPHPIDEVEMVVLRATKAVAGMECELIAYTTVSESHKIYYNLTTRGFPVEASATNVVDFGKTSQLSSTGLSAMGVIELFEAMGMVFTNKRRCRMIGAIATFNHAATILLEAYRPEGNTDGEVCFESPRRDIRLTNSLALPAAKWYNTSSKQIARFAIERILTTSLLYNFSK